MPDCTVRALRCRLSADRRLCQHMSMVPPTTDPFADGGPATRFDPFSLTEQAAEHLATVSRISAYYVAVILGTGPASARSRPSTTSLPFRAFRFLSCLTSVPKIWSLAVGDRRVLAFLGRLPLYEGYSAVEVAHPVRTAAADFRTLIITNLARFPAQRDLVWRPDPDR